jgi:hypothetical protein
VLNRPQRRFPARAVERQKQIAADKIAAKAHKTHTPIHEAAKVGDVDSLSVLVHKDNLNLLGEFGQTPMMLAAAHNRVEVMELLLKRGANMETQDDDGMTAMMWAAVNRAVPCVETLLGFGAIVSATDKDGSTAIDWAVSADTSNTASTKRRQLNPDGTIRAPESPRDRSLHHWQQVLKPREAYGADQSLVSFDHAKGLTTGYRRTMEDYAKYPGSGFEIVTVASDADRLKTIGQSELFETGKRMSATYDNLVVGAKRRARAELDRVAACDEFNAQVLRQRDILQKTKDLDFPEDEVSRWVRENVLHFVPPGIGEASGKWVHGEASIEEIEEQRGRLVEAMATILVLIKLFEEDQVRGARSMLATPPVPEPGQDPEMAAQRATLQIVEILEEASGMKVAISPAMEARKAKQRKQMGLSEHGVKDTQAEKIDISIPAGEKVYNIVAACVKQTRKVTIKDLEPHCPGPPGAFKCPQRFPL